MKKTDEDVAAEKLCNRLNGKLVGSDIRVNWTRDGFSLMVCGLEEEELTGAIAGARTLLTLLREEPRALGLK